ncbi:MAG: sulfatase, partial [Planctomycetes bacterium]|nr:sulfatase [Planctomycetota bacterium]
MAQPNILWICTDQQRYDTIAALGNRHIRTPHLDKLVSESVTFTHAFAQNTVCTPSRASFLTGRYPRTTRTRQNGQNIPADEVLVTKMLADAGYDCGLAGKLHLSACEPRHCKTRERRIDDGYRVFQWSHHPNPDWPENDYIKWLQAKGVQWKDVYEGPKGRPAYPGVPAPLHQTTWCFEKAMEFIAEPRRGPWLMSINCFDPHHPFDPPKEYLDRYDPDALPPPKYRPGELDAKPHFQRIDHQGAYGGKGMSFAKLTPRQHREVIAAYYAMIEQIDDQVGRILRFLDDTGQRQNTLVIFMTDHGEMLGDHGIYLKGPYLYDCAVRVPLILSWSGHFQAGLRSDALVELVDLVPTLLEALGMP